MSLSVKIRIEAAVDLAEARAWYENKLSGLGDRFIAAADQFFDRISSNPEIYPLILKALRRGKLRRFPYVVYYRVLADNVEIVAVLHGSRDPRVWRSRAKII